MLLLPLVARCQETIDVCTWRMFVFLSVVVILVLRTALKYNLRAFSAEICGEFEIGVGESDHPARHPPTSFFVHPVSSSVTLARCTHIQG